MFRQHMNYWFGTLSAGVSNGDLTINSAALANVPAINNPTNIGMIFPVALQDDTTGKFEVMWITNHAANATSAQVSRGKEGTSAQSWVAGSLIGHAPLAVDLRQAMPLASIVSGNYAIGDEVVDTDNSILREMTNTGFHTRIYADIAGSAGYPGVTPNNAVAVLKAFAFSFTPNSSGNGTVIYPGTAFSVGTIAVVAMPNNTTQSTTQLKAVSGSATQSQVQLAAHTASGGVPTDSVNGTMIVIGY